MLSYVQAQCYPSFVQVPHSDSGDLRYGICRVRGNSIIIIIIIIIIVNPLTARVVGAPQMILWTSIADSNPDLRSIVVSILRISCTDHVTDEEVRAKIQQAIGPHEDLLTIVKRCTLQWYGHASRSSGLAKTILQGTVKGGRRQGGQRKRWEDNILSLIHI